MKGQVELSFSGPLPWGARAIHSSGGQLPGPSGWRTSESRDSRSSAHASAQHGPLPRKPSDQGCFPPPDHEQSVDRHRGLHSALSQAPRINGDDSAESDCWRLTVGLTLARAKFCPHRSKASSSGGQSMSEVRLRFVLNRRRRGVSTGKLARIAGMVASDLGLDGSHWVAESAWRGGTSLSLGTGIPSCVPFSKCYQYGGIEWAARGSD